MGLSQINGQVLRKTKELKLLREETHKLDLQLEHAMQVKRVHAVTAQNVSKKSVPTYFCH